MQPSVLLAFRAENARSFRDRFQLSLQVTAKAEKRYIREVPWREGGTPERVLPVAGAFGANASGKSNLLKVMDDMRSYVLHSFRSGDPGGGFPRWRFLLDEQFGERPSFYEVDIVLCGVRHEYGFALDSERVVKEWAYRYPKGRASLLFHREGDEVGIGAAERSRSRAVLSLLRPNALYLSAAAAANHPTLLPLYEWFQNNLLLAEAGSRPFRQALTTEMLEDERHREAVVKLLRAADLGITGARRQEPDPVIQERLHRAARIMAGIEGEPEDGEGPTFGELTGVNLVHRANDAEVEFESVYESLGTLVWFGLVGPVLQSLEKGSVLLADELDTSLHPDLVKELVRLFQDPETNPRGAQLVFNSHDPTLLGDAVGDRLLGRDQIWFTRKLNDGCTRLYSLLDFDPRKQEAIGKRYLEGWYGARPILIPGEFDAVAELTGSENN